MSVALRVASGLATLLLVGAAFAIGAGAPLSPGRLAEATRQAADNAGRAADNTAAAARDTAALADIARNVRSQAITSRELLQTQLRLEASSRNSAVRSRRVQRGVVSIATILGSFEANLRRLATTSASSASLTEAAAEAAEELRERLDLLRRRYREVTEESRELNRKARGYQELRDGPA